MIQIHANWSKFVRNSCEIRTKFVTTKFTVHLGDEFRATFRTIFAGHWQKSHTNTTYAITKSPHPHTFPCTCPPPPRHTRTHTNTHTHTYTHTHPCTNTHIPSMKANSPPCTRPTPTHCPLTHPHTYLDSGCATVRCLGGGGFCVCVCMCVCLCVWMGFCGCVCVCGWVGRCVHV